MSNTNDADTLARLRARAELGRGQTVVTDESGNSAKVLLNFSPVAIADYNNGYMAVTVYRTATAEYPNGDADGYIRIVFIVDPTKVKRATITAHGADLQKWRNIAESERDDTGQPDIKF